MFVFLYQYMYIQKNKFQQSKDCQEYNFIYWLIMNQKDYKFNVI